jgi:hypothetical protein
VPRRNSSTPSVDVVLTSENTAVGYCSQMARSSAVIVSHPNVNEYRPGSVTWPTLAHVILLTANSLRSLAIPPECGLCDANKSSEGADRQLSVLGGTSRSFLGASARSIARSASDTA